MKILTSLRSNFFYRLGKRLTLDFFLIEVYLLYTPRNLCEKMQEYFISRHVMPFNRTKQNNSPAVCYCKQTVLGNAMAVRLWGGGGGWNRVTAQVG